ncbi:MAG: 8-amino-7-oxononanoate synthase [Chitinophagaceae bacterium]|nr:MAG: 8-amino-7-oxononanoate synthase [Chitinophagaceae bacterium]
MDAYFLQEALQKRKQENALRQLRPESQLIDLCSNDYLGLSTNAQIQAAVKRSSLQIQDYRSGSTGSRLLTGNTTYAEALEDKIASFHQAEAALLFNSGYDANLGLISVIASRHDTIIYDSLSHASIIDGTRLSRAVNKIKFEHNNLEDLEKKLVQKTGNAFVIIESIYSMDGDIALLHAISEVCKKHSAYLIVDEAHANGVFGDNGEGLVVAEKLNESVFARILTFGKAIGAHGAVVAGSNMLKEYLINFARPFIYTTALPHHTLASIHAAYDYLPSATKERKLLFENISYFGRELHNTFPGIAVAQGPIQSILLPGNDHAKRIAALLQSKGFDIRAILSPTVEKGKERLRICIHAFNTKEQLGDVIRILKESII